MRLSGQDVEAEMMATDYIDSEILELNYDNSKHLVTMKYRGLDENQIDERDFTLLFRDCFSATFNTWLAGIEGHVPQSPQESTFFFTAYRLKALKLTASNFINAQWLFP